jgi:hypothetical protein
VFYTKGGNLMVKYNRSLKAYESDVVPGAFPTRLDAESAELPPEVLDAAYNETGDLAAAIRVARVVTFGHVESLGDGAYMVTSDSGKSYCLKGRTCTCPSYRRPCKHYLAVQVWEQQREVCPTCGGTGVEIIQFSPVPYGHSETRPCPDCDPAGRLAYNVALMRGPEPEPDAFFG